MPPDDDRLALLRRRIEQLVDVNGWRSLHTPRNLVHALSVEVGELSEHFLWLTEEESASLDTARHAAVEMELADVFIYLLQLADSLGIDPLDAALRKMTVNERRFAPDT
jgi:NTP pyrophosphatase (non-canonical NTP hydrolase)